MTTEVLPVAAPAAPETPAVAAEPINLEATPQIDGQPSNNEPGAEAAPEKGADDEVSDAERQKRRDNYWKRQAEKERRERERFVERLILGQQQQAAPAPVAPKLEDYANYEAYLEESVRHKLIPQIKDELRREVETARQAESRKAFEAKIEQASERYADYEEVAGAVLRDTSFPVSPTMAEAVMASDKGPDILYWLGSHPDEAARIARLSPYAAMREIARVEDTLRPPVKRTATQAPPPPTTVKAGGDRPVKALAEMDSMEEYVAARKAGRKA